jgi:hypothetical protein
MGEDAKLPTLPRYSCGVDLGGSKTLKTRPSRSANDKSKSRYWVWLRL